MNIYSLLEQASRRFPEHGAVYVGADRVRTYAELRSRSLRLACSLRNRHRPGDRYAIASENRAEYLELLFGIWAAEGVAVPLNFKLHPKEMVQIIQDADASAVFVSPKLAHGLEAALGSNDAGGRSVVTLGSPEYAALFAGDEATPPVSDPQSLGWLFYTSGTTGVPKAAINGFAGLDNFAEYLRRDFDFGPGEKSRHHFNSGSKRRKI